MTTLVSAVENALAGVAAALPDAVLPLAHGAETGEAIKTSSVEMSGEATTESGAVEKFRVIVKTADFPTLSPDCLIFLAEVPHIVTSLHLDAIGSSKTVGLSEALSKCVALVSGVRGSHSFSFPVSILAEDNGLASDFAESVSPTTVHSWTLCVSAEDWAGAGEPQIGDEFRFMKEDEDVRVKISRCNRRDRHFILNARSRKF